jgi:hypothetical protein
LGLVKIKVSELDIQYINQRSHGNWIQQNFLGLAAMSGGWTVSKPMFREPSMFSSSRNWWPEQRRFLKHWFTCHSTTQWDC